MGNKVGPRHGKKFSKATLIAARRWNSWTPIKSELTEADLALINGRKMLGHKTGGGYIVSDADKTIAIDPGIGFLEMLYDFHQITICDIDAILVTHDHHDHSAEIPNILSLRHAYREKCKEPLAVFLNPSTFNIYDKLFSYYKPLLADGHPIKIVPQIEYRLGNLLINCIDMMHEEIIDYCDATIRERIGSSTLGIKIQGESEFISKGHFNFAIVGDTAFIDDSSWCKKISDFFGKPDIAAIHLGSIEKEWFQHPPTEASQVKYEMGPIGKGKHLGINGSAKMISLLKPHLSVITEFGEELVVNDNRRTITDIIKKFTPNIQSKILPSDIGLFIVLADDKIYCRCMNCKKYVPVNIIQVDNVDDHLYFAYKAGCPTGFEHFDL